MKRILIFLQLIIFSFSAKAADSICFDGNNAFLTTAPKGWVSDTVKAKELGLCVVYYLKGKDFDSSPAIIYPRLVTSEKDGDDAIEDIVNADFNRLKKKSVSAKISERPSIKNKFNLAFKIHHFKNGPSPNEFEAVAYHAGKKAVLLLVLSTRDEKDFLLQESALIEFADQIKPLSQSELAKLKK